METPTTPEATPSMAVEKEAETLPDATRRARVRGGAPRVRMACITDKLV